MLYVSGFGISVNELLHTVTAVASYVPRAKAPSTAPGQRKGVLLLPTMSPTRAQGKIEQPIWDEDTTLQRQVKLDTSLQPRSELCSRYRESCRWNFVAVADSDVARMRLPGYPQRGV